MYVCVEKTRKEEKKRTKNKNHQYDEEQARRNFEHIR